MVRTGFTRVVFLLAIAACSIAVVVACTPAQDEPLSQPQAEQPSAQAAEATETTQPSGSSNVLLYFAHGETIGVVGRTVTGAPAVARSALEALLAGPTSAEQEWGMGSEIPRQTELLGVDIADGVATVDLSEQFGAGGGSLSMQMRVAQVVFTLTQFESVDTVTFEIEGVPAEAIGGEGLVVSPSVDRGDFPDVTPLILVEHPVPGERVSDPIRVSGEANTFEATFQLELATSDDVISELLVSGGGSGSWEPFSATLDYALTGSAETPATLAAYYLSAKDGTRVDVAGIPVLLAP